MKAESSFSTHHHQGRRIGAASPSSIAAQEQLLQFLLNSRGKRGIGWRVIEAQASNAAVKQHLRVRGSRPDEVSDARLEDFAMLTGLYQPPVELAAGQCAKVGTQGSLDQTVTRALQSLARIQVDSPCPSP